MSSLWMFFLGFFAGMMTEGILNAVRQINHLQKQKLELEKKNYKLEETLSIQKAKAEPEWK